MQYKSKHLTYYNNKETEEFLSIVTTEVAMIFKELFLEEETAALIIIGGYGRGEGGIVIKDGTYRPHNNLDLLYIYNNTIDKNTVTLANTRLQEISKKHDLGIDMSAINKQKLLNLDGLVIGYDMRYGHKVLLGDSSFLKEHKPFSLYNIDPVDIRQLLVNRGTLLLINRLLLRKETLSIDEKKLIIKHSIKAIIGYGDALLFFNGAYHWSYAQKQSNMTSATNIDDDIKDLYSEALLFRFMPDYDTYLKKDLKSWNEGLIKSLSFVHLACEKINLSKDDLTWENYFKTALENKSYSRQSFRQKIKSILHGVNYLPALKELNSATQMGSFMQVGGRGMLSLLFPYIIYEIYPKDYNTLFQTLLEEKTDNTNNFLNAFLMQWAKWGDTNFINVLKIYDIELEKS